MSQETNGHYEFGAFRLDAKQKLLFRDGQPVPLAPKSVETLLALVENADRLVTKQELMNRVWPDTFVEEGNLTFNISQVRKALGDEPNNGNRFIQTIPRRGYRFVATLNGNRTRPDPVIQMHAVNEVPLPTMSAERFPWLRWWQTPAALGLIGLGVLGYELFRPMAAPTVNGYVSLTQDRSEKRPPLITDGLQVYFSEVVNKTVEQFSVPAKGGAVVHVVMPFPESVIVGVSADQSTKLFRKNDGTLWSAGPPNGFSQPAGAAGGDSRWSPDRSRIAYAKGHDIYIANGDGTQAGKVATAPGDASWIRWSPDGNRLRFTVRTNKGDFIPSEIWEVAVDGRGLHAILPRWHDPASECCGDWTPDGRYFVFQSPAFRDTHSELWAVREGWRLFVRSSRPQILFPGHTRFRYPTPSPDGRHLFAIGDEEQGELVAWDDRLREFVPYLRGMSAIWVTFSPDGTWAVYVDYSTNTLWRMKADGTDRKQLTHEPLIVTGPAISPDGKIIAFSGRKRDTPGTKIYQIASSGGEPVVMMPDHAGDEGIPTWSFDGNKVVYGDIPTTWGKDDGTYAIRVYDLPSHQVTFLPGSRGFWSPRWSPDGRYISAVTIDNDAVKKEELMLYDTQTRTWRDLEQQYVRDPMWSRDSKYLYCKGVGARDALGIFRVRVSDATWEQAASYDDLLRAHEWSGLSLDGFPILLRQLSGEEVYKLDINWP